MSKVLDFAQDHPDRVQDGVCPPSPNSSRGSAGYQERILRLNREFQRGPLIFDQSRSRDESTAGSDAAAEAEAVENSVAGPFLPPNNPGPRTIGGGVDPFTTLVELGDVEFAEPTRFYKMNFDPSRLRLAYSEGGAQLLVAVDPDSDLDITTQLGTSGHRAVGVQVQPRVTDQDAQYLASDCVPAPDDDTGTTDVSTASTNAALLEHLEFVAFRELSK